jgi:hypothetical protein
LLIERTPPAPGPQAVPVQPPDAQPAKPAGKRTIARETKQTTSAQLTETLSELQRAAEAHPDAEIEITWEIRE